MGLATKLPEAINGYKQAILAEENTWPVPLEQEKHTYLFAGIFFV